LHGSRDADVSNVPTLVLGTASMKTIASGTHHWANRVPRGASMCAVVTVAPCVTTTPANGVSGGPQGAVAGLGRRRTPVRDRMETLGISCQPP